MAQGFLGQLYALIQGKQRIFTAAGRDRNDDFIEQPAGTLHQ